MNMKDLRQRMIEDMKLRGLASNTQALYLHAITALAKHYRRRPDQITQEQIKDYLLYLTETRGYAKSTFKVHLFAARVRADKKLPIILSRDEVWELVDRVRRPEAHMSLTLMYTCGLRVSEAVNLRPEDIDSGRKVVWVRNGKGNKDRSVPLPVNTLADLRRYWRRQRPKRWLFPSKRGTTPISDGSVRRCLTAALWQSSINKKVKCHTLRHSYATHLLEAGVPLRVIQALLGHTSLKTTFIYMHLSQSTMADVQAKINKVMRRG
jgi:site-specific recombinase XerD